MDSFDDLLSGFLSGKTLGAYSLNGHDLTRLNRDVHDMLRANDEYRVWVKKFTERAHEPLECLWDDHGIPPTVPIHVFLGGKILLEWMPLALRLTYGDPPSPYKDRQLQQRKANVFEKAARFWDGPAETRDALIEEARRLRASTVKKRRRGVSADWAFRSNAYCLTAIFLCVSGQELWGATAKLLSVELDRKITRRNVKNTVKKMLAAESLRVYFCKVAGTGIVKAFKELTEN
jgi:hypothetical protein